MAEFLGTQHHELIVTLEDMLAALPKVIYHLESFDALLVRSSVTNYLTAKLASDYVGAVFSGEGATNSSRLRLYQEACARRENPCRIGRHHQAAAQHSASTSGSLFASLRIVALVPFADPEVLDYALRIRQSIKYTAAVRCR